LIFETIRFLLKYTSANALKISKSFNIGEEIEKPKFLKKALLIAEKLSEDFDFARIDLYIIGNRIYFGEITHYPLSGLKKITPTEFDFELGKYWKIKK